MIACVLLGALLLFLLQGSKDSGNYAIVYVGSDVQGSYPLAADTEIEITQEDGSVNRIHIENGAVSMAYSTCKNQVCVQHEEIAAQDEWIVCLPNQVSITIAKEAAHE